MKHLQDISKGLSILYVEDEDEIRNETASLLKLVFKKVYVANNGEAGIQAYKKFMPDIILSDIQMPIKTGLEMAKEIKNINDDIPIVFITAFNQNDMLLEAINIGVYKYLIKPLNKEQIVQVFTKVVTNINLKKAKDELEIKLTKSQYCLDKALEIAQVGCWEWDIENDKVWYSKSAVDIFEQNIDETTMSTSSQDIISHIHKKDQEKVKLAIEDTINNQSKLDINFRFNTKNNTKKILHIIKVNDNQNEKHIIGMVEDITQKINEKDKLAKMASQDLLTGLPNKTLYQIFLNKQFTFARRYNQSFSLLKFIINDFKELNNNLGSSKADKLIVEFTKLIQTSIRESDLLARIYGVEFAIILPKNNLQETRILIRKLKQILNKTKFRNLNNTTLNISFAAIEFSKRDSCILSFIERMSNNFNQAKIKKDSIIT